MNVADPSLQLLERTREDNRVPLLTFVVAVNLVIMTIRPQEFIEALFDFPLVPLSLSCCLLAWSFGRKNLSGPLVALVLLFLLFTTFSRVAHGWMSGAYDWFFLFLPTCLTFYFVTAASQGPAQVRLLMRTFSLCGLALVYHSLQQHFTGAGWTGERAIMERVRYIGILNDPNDLGMFLVMGLPFTMHFMGQNRGFLKKVFWALVFCSYLYTVYLTQSRGTLLACFVVLLVYFYQRIGMFVAGGLIAGGIGAVSLLPSRMQELSVTESSAQGRVDAWYSGLQMFESNPIFGVGAGSFTDHHYRTAHNTLVLVIAELGFIGTFLFIALFGYGFLMSREAAVRREADPNDAKTKLETSVAYALYLSFVGFAVSACFLSRSYNVFPYVLLGMIGGYYSYLRGTDPGLKKFRFSEDFIMWGVITVCCVLASYIVVRFLL